MAQTDKTIDGFGSELRDIPGVLSDLSPVAADIINILQTSISRNFSEGGRFGTANVFGGGSKRWEASKRADDGGQTLIDTGTLRNSTLVVVVGRTIKIGTNLVYGPVQHGGSEKLGIDARPIYVVQDEDLEDIGAVIVEYLMRRAGQ